MKALVLSGGSGTRLRPITFTSAKQLVPLANKPILFYGLEAIAAAGITEVGIVVGETHAAIEEAVGDGSRFGLEVTYLRQDAPPGLAHAVAVAPHILTTPWIDTGKLQDLLEANRIVLEGLTPEVLGTVDAASRLVGRVHIDEGAEIVRSTIRGPVVIGAGARVVDSYIGPFS